MRNGVSRECKRGELGWYEEVEYSKIVRYGAVHGAADASMSSRRGESKTGDASRGRTVAKAM